MKYLIVSIDTEEDMPEWRPVKPVTTKNILQLPRIQEIFKRYSIIPTYLVDQPVLEDSVSLKVMSGLAENVECEVGVHVHSWNTPPLSSDEKSGRATYLSNQSEEVQREKLTLFTELFKKSLGFDPVSYRAGRYGFNKQSARILYDLGYKVDSSIAPTMDFSSDGGSNFRKYDLKPFWIRDNGEKKLLEIPITIALPHKFPSFFDELYFKIPDWSRIKGIFHRLNLARLLWLRPTTYTVFEMKQLADHVLDCTDVPVLNIMFHSSEVCAGTSPYNKTEGDVQSFLDRLEAILSYLVNERDVCSVSMAGFANICESNIDMLNFPHKEI